MASLSVRPPAPLAGRVALAGRALVLALVTALLLLAAPPRAHAASADTLDTEAVADFFDTRVPGSLRRHRVPGAVVSVVHDGRVVFAEGYGMADVERRAEFDPETSLVRIASISKLFTWTAVMQLVEDGALDLDRDVNAYLDDLRIPDTFREPVTLNHLMTHTAGFEERGIGIGARDKRGVPPLGEYLADHLPARIRPPGEIPAYSNHGAAVAGHIVSEVAGVPYERYVEDAILRPLHMRHSTAYEPVPERLADDLARSYEYVGGVYERVPFVFDRLVPDGSISASATDMANFMIAHLRNGRFEGARILDAATTRQMHEQSFTATPAVNGWAHGFKERTMGGRRVLMHDGSWEAFQSALLLIPSDDLGVFVSYNGTGGIDAATELLPEFFDRVLPPAASLQASQAAPSGAGALEEQVDGFYRATRRSATTIEKVLTLVESSRATLSGEGTLRFGGRRWRRVAPGVYRQVDGTERLALVAGRDGSLAYLATDGPAYEKLAWYETVQVNLAVVALFLVAALTVVVGWPALAAVRRLRRRRAPARSRSWRTARRLTGAACTVGLVFVVGFVLTLVGDTSAFLYGVPAPFRVLMLLPLAFLGLVAATVVPTVRAVRAGDVGLPGLVHQVVVGGGVLALIWFLWHWNLIGWRFG